MKMECFGINSILNTHVDLAFFFRGTRTIIPLRSIMVYEMEWVRICSPFV